MVREFALAKTLSAILAADAKAAPTVFELQVQASTLPALRVLRAKPPRKPYITNPARLAKRARSR